MLRYPFFRKKAQPSKPPKIQEPPDLEKLAQSLQPVLQLQVMHQRLQVRCAIRQEHLFVLVEHLLHIEPDAKQVFVELEAMVRENVADQVRHPSFPPQGDKYLPIRLFLRIAGHLQPYDLHTFSVSLNPTSYVDLLTSDYDTEFLENLPSPRELLEDEKVVPTAAISAELIEEAVVVIREPVAPPIAPPPPTDPSPLIEVEPEVEPGSEVIPAEADLEVEPAAIEPAVANWVELEPAVELELAEVDIAEVEPVAVDPIEPLEAIEPVALAPIEPLEAIEPIALDSITVEPAALDSAAIEPIEQIETRFADVEPAEPAAIAPVEFFVDSHVVEADVAEAEPAAIESAVELPSLENQFETVESIPVQEELVQSDPAQLDPAQLDPAQSDLSQAQLWEELDLDQSTAEPISELVSELVAEPVAEPVAESTPVLPGELTLEPSVNEMTEAELQSLESSAALSASMAELAPTAEPAPLELVPPETAAFEIPTLDEVAADLEQTTQVTDDATPETLFEAAEFQPIDLLLTDFSVEALTEEPATSSVDFPAAIEPIAIEPIASRLIESEMLEAEMLQREPLQDEARQPESILQEPILQEPILQEPILQEPILQEPILQEPILQEPILQEQIFQEEILQAENLQEETSQEAITQEAITQEEATQEGIYQESFYQEDIQEEVDQEDTSQNVIDIVTENRIAENRENDELPLIHPVSPSTPQDLAIVSQATVNRGAVDQAAADLADPDAVIPVVIRNKGISYAEVLELEAWGNRQSLIKRMSLSAWIFAGTVGAFSIVAGIYALTRPCVLVIGKCQPVEQARQISDRAIGTIQTTESALEIVDAYNQLRQVNTMLSPIPFWSLHYGTAQEIIAASEARASRVSLIVSALEKANEAAQKSQNPPHPLARWREIQWLWRDAIAALQRIPVDSPVYDLAQRRLKEYEASLVSINRRVALEQDAQNRVSAARKTAEVAEAQAGIAKTAQDWQQSYTAWQAAVQVLNQIPQGTMAYTEAEELLTLYEPRLREANQRQMQELIAENAWREANLLAEQARLLEQQNLWVDAKSVWQNAVASLQRIPQETTYYTQAQTSIRAYTESIGLSEKNSVRFNAMQSVQSKLDRACMGTVLICTYSFTPQSIQVQITRSYDLATERMMTSGSSSGAQTSVTNQVRTLLRSLADISESAQVPVELYNANGSRFGTYSPEASGYVAQ